MYCVYLTTYAGDKLPPFYVGSTSKQKITEGYKGSVSSAEWKAIWEYELKNHPDLFNTWIISEHSTRKEALEAELKYQIENNVVESTQWINKSLAQPNGFFGMDVSGKNNPMYGSNRTGEKHKGGENISAALQNFFMSEQSQNHRQSSRSRFKTCNPTSNPETLQKIKQTWKARGRGIGEKNGMFGKTSPSKGKKLYNNGKETKAFIENKQPEGWNIGRHKTI